MPPFLRAKWVGLPCRNPAAAGCRTPGPWENLLPRGRSNVGGGAGEGLGALIPAPKATYTYTVGTSGNGGAAGGQAGGRGADGRIEITVYLLQCLRSREQCTKDEFERVPRSSRQRVRPKILRTVRGERYRLGLDYGLDMRIYTTTGRGTILDQLRRDKC